MSKMLSGWVCSLCLLCAQTTFAGNPTTHTAKKPTSRPVVKQNNTTAAPGTRAAAPAASYSPVPKPRAFKPNPKARHNVQLDNQVLRMIQFLQLFLIRHGRDPKNPWLLAHSLIALGSDLKLPGGQLAIDRVVSGYLRSHKEGAKEIFYFPPGTQRDRIEPHPYMHLKTLLQIGVPMSRKFKVGDREVSLKQIFQSALHSFPQGTPKDLGKYAWLMSALYGHLEPKDWVWLNSKGQQIRFFRFVWSYFKHTDKQTSFLRILQQRGVKKIPKRRQYIYGEPCGGFHMLQSAMRWMSHPMFKKKLQPLFDAQLELMFYRFEGEMNLYVDLFKKYQKHPAYRFIILLQQLKFAGHFLETIVKLHKWGLFTPNQQQQLKIRHAVKVLMVTVLLLNRLGFYQKLLALKTKAYQYYLDLLGDSAHALYALKRLHHAKLYHMP